MTQSRSLHTVVAPVLRRIYSCFVSSDPLLPSCLRRQRELVEPLEPRRFIDSLGPMLTLQYFTTTTPGLTTTLSPADTKTVGVDQMADFASSVPSDYNPGAPFHALFTGSITTDDATPTKYYFSLPAAEGAILTIDGKTVIYQPSITGDANMDGAVGLSDYNILAGHFNTTGPWSQGDFNADGQIGLGDYNLLGGMYNHIDAAHVISNTAAQTNDPNASIGFLLGQGTHTFSLDYYQFNTNPDAANTAPSANITWTINPQSQTWNSLSSLAASPYQAPKVTPTPLMAVAGQQVFAQVGSFTSSSPLSVRADYAATINWSDGSSDFGTISPDVHDDLRP